jgi:hypothetical protein
MMLNLGGLGDVLPQFQDAANKLLAAALSAGYSASLSVTGDNPLLILQGKSIPITNSVLDDLNRYQVSPSDWVRNQVTGELVSLTASTRATSQAEQLAALIAAGRTAKSGADVVQDDVNNLLAFWANQGTPYNPAQVDVSRLNPELLGWVPSLAETQFYHGTSVVPAVISQPAQVSYASTPSQVVTPSTVSAPSTPATVSTPSTVSSVVESALNSVGASDLVSAGTLSSIPTWAWIVGAAAIAWFAFGKK